MRTIQVLAALAAIGLTYRVVFIYQIFPEPCPLPRVMTPNGVAAVGMNGTIAVIGPIGPIDPINPINKNAAAAASAAPAAAQPVAITVLSYNIGGHSALVRSGHLAAIASTIAEHRPDVVGLQEVHRGTWQARFRDQAAELARATGMEVFYGPSFKVWGGEFGNAVLVRGRVLRGEVVGLPSFGEPRSLLRVTVEIDGRELDVWVTHLSAWGSINRRMRTAQARCLAEHVRASGRPFVLCGDLNATPTTPDLAGLVGGDFLRLCGLASEPTHALLGRRIDYIFSDPRFTVLDAQVIHAGPSDHWPILTRLAWPGEGG